MWIELFKDLTFGLVAKISTRFFQFFYNSEKLHDDIDIGIRASNGLSISFGGNVPEIKLHLQISNRSPYLDIEFDRAEVEVWWQQPFLILLLMGRISLKRRKPAQDIFGRAFLNCGQINCIKNCFNNEKHSSHKITLEIRAYFNTPYGTIEKLQKIDTEPKLSGNIDRYSKLLNDI